MASTSTSPCAACKFLRRKCQPECVFAPYFPPDQPQKFSNVHKVFGASNVTKLLNELHPHQREDAVNSLAYEADMRLRDPVYGCVGVISILQHQLRQLQMDLLSAKLELSKYQKFGLDDRFFVREQKTCDDEIITSDSISKMMSFNGGYEFGVASMKRNITTSVLGRPFNQFHHSITGVDDRLTIPPF